MRSRLHLHTRDKVLVSMQQRLSLPFMGTLTHWWIGTTRGGNLLGIYREKYELEVRLNGEVIFRAYPVHGLLSQVELLKYLGLRMYGEEQEEEVAS